jgi:circadian clock protein KaiC
LDLLLGGGLDRGTSTMFMGPPGTGKSTLALGFVGGAADRGERVLYYAFDETSATLIARSKELGMNVDRHLKSGLMRIQQVDPAETTPGEFTHRIRKAVEEENARFVVIDSLNGYLNAMPGERYLNLQLHELLAYLNQQGVVTIMILAQQGLVGAMTSAVDLTYLADTVVLLRYFETRGAVKQAVSVIKKRSGNHERTIREISTNKDGITVGEPLTDFHGVLTGIPTFADRSNGTG